MPVELIDNFKNEYSFIDNDGPVFYFKTDLEAPRGRVIAIDIRKPEPANWNEIIPQAKENLTGVGMVGNLFVAHYLKDAHTQVKLFTTAGKFVREVSFPGIGTAAGFGGQRDRHGNVLLVLQLCHAAHHLSLRHGHAAKAS